MCEPDVLSRLKRLGNRLKIILDDSAADGKLDSAEMQAAKDSCGLGWRCERKAPPYGEPSHNKSIAVDGPKVQAAVRGSINFSWHGFFVQADNALILWGKKARKIRDRELLREPDRLMKAEIDYDKPCTNISLALIPAGGKPRLAYSTACFNPGFARTKPQG